MTKQRETESEKYKLGETARQIDRQRQTETDIVNVRESVNNTFYKRKANDPEDLKYIHHPFLLIMFHIQQYNPHHVFFITHTHSHSDMMCNM